MSMQEAAKQLADSIVNATAVTHNTASSPQQRAEAVRFFEQVRAAPRAAQAEAARAMPRAHRTSSSATSAQSVPVNSTHCQRHGCSRGATGGASGGARGAAALRPTPNLHPVDQLPAPAFSPPPPAPTPTPKPTSCTHAHARSRPCPPPAQLKHGEIHSTVFATAVLTGTQYALEVQVRAWVRALHVFVTVC